MKEWSWYGRWKRGERTWENNLGVKSMELKAWKCFRRLPWASPGLCPCHESWVMNWAGYELSWCWNLCTQLKLKKNILITIPEFSGNNQQPWTSGLEKARCSQTLLLLLLAAMWSQCFDPGWQKAKDQDAWDALLPLGIPAHGAGTVREHQPRNTSNESTELTFGGFVSLS